MSCFFSLTVLTRKNQKPAILQDFGPLTKVFLTLFMCLSHMLTCSEDSSWFVHASSLNNYVSMNSLSFLSCFCFFLFSCLGGLLRPPSRAVFLAFLFDSRSCSYLSCLRKEKEKFRLGILTRQKSHTNFPLWWKNITRIIWHFVSELTAFGILCTNFLIKSFLRKCAESNTAGAKPCWWQGREQGRWSCSYCCK